MKTKIWLMLPVIAVLSGCVSPLKPNSDISKYYIIPGTTFVATQLCGVSAGAESCIRLQNGDAVKSLIKSDFKSWISTLDSNEQIVSHSGKKAIVLDQSTGEALINSLTKDNQEREEIKMQKYDDRNDR